MISTINVQVVNEAGENVFSAVMEVPSENVRSVVERLVSVLNQFVEDGSVLNLEVVPSASLRPLRFKKGKGEA